MKQGIRVAAAAGSVFLGTGAAVMVGNLLWERATARAVARLYDGVSRSTTEMFSDEELKDLPAPVARYFRFALTPGRPLFSRLRVIQAGEMRVGGFGSPWKPFTAVQHFTNHPPGFVWDARICAAPFLMVQVRDSYLDGAGGGQVRMASLLTFAGQSGCPELNAGALHRYLAEAVWCPTALLPSQGVVWKAVDDGTAQATLTDGGTSVSLEFGFGEHGEIVYAHAPNRFREVRGKFVPTPWTCRYSDYARINGMMVPLQGEMEWRLPEGRFPCVRNRLLDEEWKSGKGL